MALHLTAVQEDARLRIEELQGTQALQPAVLVQGADEGEGILRMDLAGVSDAAALEDVRRHVIGRKGGRLSVVVALHVFADGAGELPGLHQLAVALVDGAAETVGAGHEAHVLRADAVPEKAGEGVRRNEDAADVPEMQGLVAVGHAGGDHGTGRPDGPAFALQI